MINVGLIRRALRETWGTTLLLGGVLFAFAGVLAIALPRFQRQVEEKLQAMPFLQVMREAMLGEGAGTARGAEIAVSIAWAHPAILSLIAAHAIICCTRVPAAEVERGSIDILMGLPISRWQLHLAEGLAWVGGIVALLALGICGSLVGSRFVEPALRPDPWTLLIVVANLGALAFTVAGCATLFSTLSDRRGRAAMAGVVLTLGWLVLNYLAGIWEPAQSVRWLSAFDYYRPLEIVTGKGWPLANLAVLLGTGLVAWIVAGVVFSRRALASL
ncbi:MAG: ABC transporter permease subunit [Phycisphaerales bacterium]|nr:ABC transporter permease subunit [Phycisphaerales bacterium]